MRKFKNATLQWHKEGLVHNHTLIITKKCEFFVKSSKHLTDNFTGRQAQVFIGTVEEGEAGFGSCCHFNGLFLH